MATTLISTAAISYLEFHAPAMGGVGLSNTDMVGHLIGLASLVSLFSSVDVGHLAQSALGRGGDLNKGYAFLDTGTPTRTYTTVGPGAFGAPSRTLPGDLASGVSGSVPVSIWPWIIACAGLMCSGAAIVSWSASGNHGASSSSGGRWLNGQPVRRNGGNGSNGSSGSGRGPPGPPGGTGNGQRKNPKPNRRPSGGGGGGGGPPPPPPPSDIAAALNDDSSLRSSIWLYLLWAIISLVLVFVVGIFKLPEDVASGSVSGAGAVSTVGSVLSSGSNVALVHAHAKPWPRYPKYSILARRAFASGLPRSSPHLRLFAAGEPRFEPIPMTVLARAAEWMWGYVGYGVLLGLGMLAGFFLVLGRLEGGPRRRVRGGEVGPGHGTRKTRLGGGAVKDGECKTAEPPPIANSA